MHDPEKKNDVLTSLQQAALAFRDQRDWQQFHAPKNLAQGLAIEAAELMEVFLWKTTEASRQLNDVELERVKEEVGDITLFLLTFCHELNIDLADATFEKLALNEEKYPVERAKGNSTKYTDYD